MSIINRKDQTEGATRKKKRGGGGEEDVGKKQEDDERKRGGRHMYGDEKGDTQHETEAEREREEEKSISGWYRKKGNVIGLCIRPKRRRIFGLNRQIHMDIYLTAV